MTCSQFAQSRRAAHPPTVSSAFLISHRAGA